MIRKTIVALAACVMLLGAPGAALAGTADADCKEIPVLGWQACIS